MTTKPDDDIAAFLADWTTTETGRDVETFDRQLAPDFTGIGPLGFTLTKTNWLDRHATGALTYNTFRLEELHLRAYGDTAVVTAHQITEGTYQGHPLPGQLRVTLALVRQTGRWRLTVAHMSFIAGTPVPRRSPADHESARHPPTARWGTIRDGKLPRCNQASGLPRQAKPDDIRTGQTPGQ